MSESKTYSGQCFCGAVNFRLQGEPQAMAYCHCDSCRQWSAGPVSAFTLWKPEALEITRGADQLSVFTGNPISGDPSLVSERTWCKSCGGHLFTGHPTMGLVDIPAVLIQELDFSPGFHVHYQESVHPMADGLQKFRDLPEPAGGSGELIPE